MFGTGGKGFAIITVVIPVITYALVFNLLHPTTKKGIEYGMKRAIFTWPRLLWLLLRNGIKTAVTWPRRLWHKLRGCIKKVVTWFQYHWRKLWDGKEETPQV
jgi:hypothetical protein